MQHIFPMRTQGSATGVLTFTIMQNVVLPFCRFIIPKLLKTACRQEFGKVSRSIFGVYTLPPTHPTKPVEFALPLAERTSCFL